MRLNTQSCNYDFLWIDTDEWVWGWTDKKLTPVAICSHSHAKRLLLRLYSISSCVWRCFCSEGPDVCGCPGEDHFSHHDWTKQTILRSGESVWNLFLLLPVCLFIHLHRWLLTPDLTDLLSFTSGQQTITFPHGDVPALNLKIVGIFSARHNTLDGGEVENHFCCR